MYSMILLIVVFDIDATWFDANGSVDGGVPSERAKERQAHMSYSHSDELATGWYTGPVSHVVHYKETRGLMSHSFPIARRGYTPGPRPPPPKHDQLP